MTAAPHGRPLSVVVIGVLGLYAAMVAVVGLWPHHIDDGAAGFVDHLLSLLPGLTYNRLEFASNVAFFVPLAALATLLVRDGPTALFAIPLSGLAVSALIETIQTDFLPGRTGSTLDVIAQTLGATAGCLAPVAVRARVRRRALKAAGDSPTPGR